VTATSDPHPATKAGRGIALKIISTFVFTLMSVCVKLVADRIPPGEIVFARSFFALIPVVAMLLWQGQLLAALKTRHPGRHATRGAIGICSMAFGFTALGFLPLPEAMVIGYAAPLMVVALSAIILGEIVRFYRWTATAIGFVGILIILWPRLTFFEGAGFEEAALIGASLALLGAISSAFAAIFIRSMTRIESTGSIVIYFAISGTLFSLLSLPFGWTVPNAHDAWLLVAIGLLGGLGQILMTSAYRYAGAATIASFEYVSMIWGLTFGYLVFGEVPTSAIIVGGAIVIAAGIFIIFRERRLGLERPRAPMPPSG
jgi:drug/metabolite transporter (DMT)-like permease